MRLGFVYWEEDPDRKRKVKALCRRCRDLADGGDVEIVSPSGIAHEQHEHDLENTACGIDATGPDWWWRS